MARVIAWFAGESWRTQVFKDGGDIYCASASQMFKVPVEKHGVNGHLRQKGKIAELALGYGGSVGALKSMGALDMGDPFIEPDVKKILIENVLKIAVASNYNTGATQIEMRINQKGCYVIESACRPGGGGALYKVFSDAYDVNVFKLFIGLFIKDNVETKVDYSPKKLSMLYIVPQTEKGIIKEIQGLQEIIDLKEIFDYFIWKMPGDKLLREDINLEYIAFLFASYGDAGKNKDYAIKMASYYDNKIKVVCE